MDFAAMKPADLRGLIRKGELTGPTTGMCNGYAQGNLVVLPKALAWDFLLFCQRNPKACPLLEVADAGERTFAQFGKGSDIATDIPRYRVYEHGELTGEYTDVSKFFEERNDLVSFLIGCSFSFESELLEAGIPVRQIEEGVNVPMYNTNIPCTPAGVFSGNMVVSMRPIPYRQGPGAAGRPPRARPPRPKNSRALPLRSTENERISGYRRVEPLARDQLFAAAGFGELRPPHRPYGPRRQPGYGHHLHFGR